jgi:hypothetical protein
MEKARGCDFEQRVIPNAALRLFVRLYRRFFWARDPLNRNHLLEDFATRSSASQAVICGDLTCDTGFVGVSDAAAFASAAECLDTLRRRFPSGLDVAHGDHDLGKETFFGGQGGMRIESLNRLRGELACPDFWSRRVGVYHLVGVASSLVAYPSFKSEALEIERPDWERERKAHIARIGEVFASMRDGEKALLFCHDPTALPRLLEIEAVRRRLDAIEHTFIGHLHSNLIMAKSRLLAGMPRIGFLGHTVSKLSAALREARLWRPFHVTLCPALAGIELLGDGGFYEVELAPEGEAPARLRFCPLRPDPARR